MNSAEPEQIDLKQAARILFRALQASAEDQAEQGRKKKPLIVRRGDVLRIITRETRTGNNTTGGDYDFWIDVYLSTQGEGVIIEEDWSADWDYADWGGAVFCFPGFHSEKALQGLVALARWWELVAKGDVELLYQHAPDWHPLGRTF